MVTITPITIAAGTTTYAAVAFQEHFCRAIPSGAKVSVTVLPQVGALRAVGGVTVAPVSCLITVTYPTCANGCTRSYQFIETVLVGVTGAAETINVVASNVEGALNGVQCCKAHSIAVTALLTITSTTAA